MTYPSWCYYPANARPPAWTHALAAAVKEHEAVVSTAEAATGLSSDAVLRQLAPDLALLGYTVENGKSRMGKISRPVLFEENGKPLISYEVDAFHKELGIVIEVEAGRGARGNADYRDLLRTSLILDAQYLALLLPLAYRFRSGERDGVETAFRNTKGLLDAVYASRRLQFPFDGILLMGY
jgi:hypothetical protein